jgi:carbamoyl-phosphate synthase large subunit
LQAIIGRAILGDEGLQIIECNTRFGGASTASIAAGLDSFYWSLLESSGADVSQAPFLRIPGEVRQVRAPTDTYVYGPTL